MVSEVCAGAAATGSERNHVSATGWRSKAIRHLIGEPAAASLGIRTDKTG
jgi:hypothetical protein